MSDEPRIRITNPTVPDLEFQWVTQAAFDQVWTFLGWVLADPEDQEDVVYSIPSTEKGAPFGVATLDATGKVVQAGQGPTGGVTQAEMDDAIADAIALVTPASIGAHPVTTPVIVYVDDVQSTPMRSTHPVANGLRQDYALGDGTCWVMAPLGQKTQVAPGFVNPTVILALEQTIDTLTLETVLTNTLEPEGVYQFEIVGPYESTVAASGERLRLFLDVPPGATGFWQIVGLTATQASQNSSVSHEPKLFSETFDLGGSGAGTANSRLFRILGQIYCDTHEPAPDAEANFDFRARLSTVDGAGVPLVPAKIYGANTADFDACRMTFTRLA